MSYITVGINKLNFIGLPAKRHSNGVSLASTDRHFAGRPKEVIRLVDRYRPKMNACKAHFPKISSILYGAQMRSINVVGSYFTICPRPFGDNFKTAYRNI